MMVSTLFFWILALLSVVSAIMVVASNNPVRSALALVVTFLCVAVFYVMLSAQFIAAVQVIVYAGAIMVLFLFVIMLLNLSAPETLRERGTLQRPLALFLGVAFIAILVFSQSLFILPHAAAAPAAYARLGEVQSIGLNLFDPKQPWLFPFEITSILLLVAIIGAIIMAKRRV
jgi:NADH-quinone oxidoreductase subunit J